MDQFSDAPTNTALPIAERRDGAAAAPAMIPPADATKTEGDPSRPNDERPPGGYTLRQRQFHWATAALVILQIVGGVAVAGALAHSAPGFKPGLLTGHAILGTLIFIVVAARLRLRQKLGAPPPPEGTPQDAALLARLNHIGFYGLLLVMPVVGWAAYVAERPDHSFAGALHIGLALILVLAICLHLGGTAYHTYVRRDGLLRRMTNGGAS